MKKSLAVLCLLVATTSSFAGENYSAKDLKVGTIVELKNDLNFQELSTVTFIQEGKTFNKVVSNELVGFDAENSYCSISVKGMETMDPETRSLNPLKKGDVYQVDKVSQSVFSKRIVDISLSSGSGRKLDLSCAGSNSNSFIKMNNIKMSLGNLVEIKD